MTEQTPEPSRLESLFFEIYRDLPRAGPGEDASARRALQEMSRLPPAPRILDMGCGPGIASLFLARATGGRLTSFDLHFPFVARLRAAARDAGVADRIDGLCADMRTPPFPDESFDLVWSEGALYSIGFREGLGVCRRLLKPGGYLAASEAVWTVSDPPEEVRAWWESEYPAIAPIESKAADITAAGFHLTGHFTLPAEAWRENYYEPMRRTLAELRLQWAGDETGLGILAAHEHEIAMYERFGHAYGYEFFVARRPSEA